MSTELINLNEEERELREVSEYTSPTEALKSIRSQSTTELLEEIETRLAVNPSFARRIPTDDGGLGFVELEESWGWEGTILNTARISASNRRVRPGDPLTESDRQLLYYLLKHDHGTPFERVYFNFRIIAPQFVIKQWLRHRISSFNEYSMRYRTGIQSFYVPSREARTVNGFEIMSASETREYIELLNRLYEWYAATYDKILARIKKGESEGKIPALGSMGGRNPYRGRARELLRNAMPMSSYTDLYWTVNFRSLMNFMSLRCGAPVDPSEHAQYEIRKYADLIFEFVKARFPVLAEVWLRVLEEDSASDRSAHRNGG